MKIGIRTPSLKKSISARTKGRWMRATKRLLNPFYGRRGMGILHPKRAIKSKIYKKTTIDPLKKLR